MKLRTLALAAALAAPMTLTACPSPQDVWFHLNCWGVDWGSDDQRDQPGYVDPRLDPRCWGSSGGGGGGGFGGR